MDDEYKELRKAMGVVGFGNFGSFFAKAVRLRGEKLFDVTACDTVDYSNLARSLGIRWGTPKEVAHCDIVVLAVPLQVMEEVIQQIAGSVKPKTLVMDVCSVKQRPLELMRKYLPHAELLSTHPLFGPQSAKLIWDRHKIVVCKATSSPRTKLVLQFFRHQGLKVIRMSAKRHDQEMARVQGLTHFIAQALAACEVQETPLSTVAHRHLAGLTKLLSLDSWELFQTIQNGNPFAAEVRKQFMDKLEELEERLKSS